MRDSPSINTTNQALTIPLCLHFFLLLPCHLEIRRVIMPFLLFILPFDYSSLKLKVDFSIVYIYI